MVELRDSEANYLKRLEIIEDVFHKPLTKLAGTADEVLDHDQIRTLLGPVEPLRPLNQSSINKSFKDRLGKLGDATPKSDVHVGDIFAELRSSFFEAYTKYATIYVTKMRPMLLALNKHNKRWQKYCQTEFLAGTTQGCYVQDLLITPIQRVCQYKLFLEDLVPLYGHDASETASLNKAIAHLERETADLRRLMDEDLEEIGRVDRVHRSLIPMQDTFPHEPYRRLVKEGYLYFEQPSGALKKVYVHLFNDSTLISFPMKWKFLTSIVLFHKEVRDLKLDGDVQRMIKIESKSLGGKPTNVRLYGHDEAQAQEWLEAIKDERELWGQEGAQMEREAESAASRAVPDAQRRRDMKDESPQSRMNLSQPQAPRKKSGPLICRIQSTSKGNKLKAGWQSRFVKVEDDMLMIYSHGEPVAKDLLVCVPLTRTVVAIPHPRDLKGNKSLKYAFSIVTGHEKYYFAPEKNTKESMESWLRVVQTSTQPVVDIKGFEAASAGVDRRFEHLQTELMEVPIMGSKDLAGLEVKARASGDLSPEVEDLISEFKSIRSAQDRKIQDLIKEVESIKKEQKMNVDDIQKVLDELSVKEKLIKALTRENADLLAGTHKDTAAFNAAADASLARVSAAEFEERSAQKDRDMKVLKLEHEEEMAKYKKRELAWSQVYEDAEAGDEYLDPFIGWMPQVWPNYNIRGITAAMEGGPTDMKDTPRRGSAAPMVGGAYTDADWEDDPRTTDLQHKYENLEAEHRKMQKEKHQLAEQLENTQEDAKALMANMRTQNVSSIPPSEYASFLRQKSEHEAWLHDKKAFYQASLLMDFKNADLEKMKADYERYQAGERVRLQAEERKLRDVARNLQSRKCADPCSVEEVDRLWTNLSVAERMYEDMLKDEEIRRNVKKRYTTEFHDEASRLLEWCRMQKGNLVVLEEPDQIQEFCASLQNTFIQMESNFEVLTEMGEGLLPDKDVEHDLLEVSEVWLNLQIYAYEKLRHTLLEIHSSSKLEDEVRSFAPFSKRMKVFVDEVEKLLSVPTDEESMEVVRPVLKQCHRLQAGFGPHNLLMDHLSDFSIRMECLRDNFDVLKKSVLSKLTFMSRHMGLLNATYSRQKEFDSNVADLSGWIGTASQQGGVPSLTFGGWTPMQRQVDSLKMLLEQELSQSDKGI